MISSPMELVLLWLAARYLSASCFTHIGRWRSARTSRAQAQDREARASPSHELRTVYDAADCDIWYRTTSGLSTVLHLRSLRWKYFPPRSSVSAHATCFPDSAADHFYR